MRTVPATRAGLLAVGVALAATVRAVVAGAEGPSSVTAALVFAVALVALALIGGGVSGLDALVRRLRTAEATQRTARPAAGMVHWTQALLMGACAGAVLAAVPLIARADLASVAPGSGRLGSRFAGWAFTVLCVAVAEELVLRGALFTALLQAGAGPLGTTLCTALIFGLIHVPLYGWVAVPLDVAVGLSLGGLRLLTGGVVAPAVAHVLADLVTWWVV